MRKFVLSLLVMLLAGMDYAFAATIPTLSTPDNPVLYYIRNTRQNKYATLVSTNDYMTEDASKSTAAMFWFEKAGEFDGTYQPVKIHNITTGAIMGGFNNWTPNGSVWYIRESNVNSDYLGIGNLLNSESNNSSWWNDNGGSWVKSWAMTGDQGSIWDITEVPAAEQPAMTTITWNLKDENGTVVRTASAAATQGYSYDVPMSLAVTMNGQTTVTATASNQTVDLTFTVDLPFKPSASNTTGTWYKCIMRPDYSEGPKYLHYDNPEVSVKSSNVDVNDMGSWFCFVGNAIDGFKIYCAALTSDKALGGNSGRLTALDVADAPTFSLEKNVTSTRTYYVFKNNAVVNGYLNDNNSYLAYWISSNAGTDWGSDWRFEAVDDDLNARINAAGTISYNCYYNGNLLATKTFRALGGEAYPAVPAVKGFKGTAPEGTVNGDAALDIQMTPIITSSVDYASATWFRLINKPTSDPRYLNYQEGATAYEMTTEGQYNDAYMWAFIGDPISGYKIINKAAGEGMYLNATGANGAYPVMGSEEQVWTYDELSDQSAFGLGTNGYWINNFANAGKLSLWQSGPTGDAGSTLTIEPVTIVNGLYADADGNLLINNANDLVAFAAVVAGGQQDANGLVMADIDLTGIDFAGIGTSAVSYKGTFDGQNHTISGYTKEATEPYTGLFGKCEGATVKNIIFKGDLTVSFTANQGAGMVAFANGGTYTNLISYLNITQTAKAPHTAGVVGSLQGGAKVSYCAYYGTYTFEVGNGVANDSFGGVVGYTNTGSIDHCIFGGTLTRQDRHNNTGCVLGYVNNGSFGGLTNSISYGNAQSVDGSYTSAIVGNINTSTPVASVHDNYWMEGASDRYAHVSSSNTDPTTGVLTQDDFKSGKAAYLTGLYQNLAEDAYPSVDASRGQVYAARLHCDGSPYDEFTNTETTPVRDAHVFEGKVCTVCGQLETDEDGFFAISSADDWKLFVKTVNSGETKAMATNAKLTADIDLASEAIDPVGNTTTVVYKGTFDGQGYTINNYYGTASDFSTANVGFGLFGRVEAATIKNFSVNGKFEGTGAAVDGAGIGTIGYVVNSTLDHIVSNIDITMDNTGNGGHVGGLCGSLRDGAKMTYCEYDGTITANAGNQRAGLAAYSNTGTISNSIFNGTINYSGSGAGIGGILGYVNSGSFGGIHNCLSVGTLNITGSSSNVAMIGANLKNCNVSAIEKNYYVGDKGAAGTKSSDATVLANMTAVTADQVASGEITYLMNGDQSDIEFFQTVGTDACPSVKGTSIVYKVAKKNCTTGEEIVGEYAYANTQDAVTSHNYVNGICTDCGMADESYKEADADGYYDLATAADVEWFGAMVNKNLLVTINGRLTADIDYEGVENAHTPIGLNTTYKFNGKFDGQGHRIMNMIINLPDYDAGVGLFGVIRGGTVIENVIIDKSCSITAKNRVAAIAGSAQTLVTNDTWTIIRNCINEAPLTATNGAAAMAIGGGQSQYPLLLVENCVNAGKITANNKAAGFIGWNNSGSGPGKNSRLVNCVNIAEVSVLDGTSTLFRGSFRSTENDYDLVNTGSAQSVKYEWKTADPIASGELCWYLNENYKKVYNGDKVYFQTIGTDAYPVPFTTSDTVYAVGTYNCDGSMIEYTSFSNNSSDVKIPDHEMVNGICANCGIADENYITPDEDGWYHLATTNDVEWFSAMVNENRMGGMNVKLDNDIDYEGVENAHMPIGRSASKFFGHFDGQNHSIKGMVITETMVRDNADYDGWGFFGSIRGGGEDKNGVTYENCTIENLTIDKSCSIQTNKKFAAGVVGHANSCVSSASVITIKNCGNQANVTAAGNNAAGILGCVESTQVGVVITNCYNAGNITGANESAAICGWTGSAADGLVKEASNCWNVGQVNGVDANGYNLFRIPASGIALTNCYELCESNTGVQGRDFTFATEDPATSGELAWQFNQNAGEKLMAQALGVDMYPTFGSTMEVFQTSNGGYGNDYTIDTITWEPSVVDEKYNDTYGDVKGTFKFCGEAKSISDDAIAFIMSKEQYDSKGIYDGKHLYGAMAKRGDINFNSNGEVEMNFTCFSSGTSEPLFQKSEEDETKVEATSDFVVIILKNALEFNSGLYGKNMIFDNQQVLDNIIEEFVTAAQSNTDGIKNVNAENENAEIYNVSGQRVQKTSKGQVYIIDGKKLMK